MKLLVLTQKIDINDDVLGFMRGWIAELSKHCEKITVIALSVGKYDLPENVKILSLGKEKKNSLSFPRRRESRMIDGKSGAGIINKVFMKINYAINFYKYILRERKNYDAVFVHMNKEYILLGGVLWKLWGKKVYLWYNHQKGDKNSLQEILNLYLMSWRKAAGQK